MPTALQLENESSSEEELKPKKVILLGIIPK
jgi:hypothetical protein